MTPIALLGLLMLAVLLLYIYLCWSITQSKEPSLFSEGFSSKLAIKDLPPRVKSALNQEIENRWGFIPDSPTLTGNSQTKTYSDIYGYWDPNYNYTDYWNYGYPLLVYPRRGFTNYWTFGHPLYSFGSKSLATLGVGLSI